jgi:hypothetical protein
MRVIVASILCAAVSAFRTNIHADTVGSRVQKRSGSKWGATCESLQSRFSEQLAAVQDQVDQIPEAGLSSGPRMRLTMRVFGIGRTLRRAGNMECTWVEGTNEVNAERVRILLETLLERNPCADAAQAEMSGIAANATEQDRAEGMQRAMSILSSDTCEATPIEGQGAPEVEVGDEQILALEEQSADGCEDMVEGIESEGSSFVETDAKYATERLLRFLVVVAIYLFLVFICTWVVVWVGLFIISYFTMLLGMIGVYVSGILWRDLILPPAMLACGYDLFWRILNPEIHALNR